MIFAARICSLFFGAVAAAGVAWAAPAGNPDLDLAKVELVPHLAIYDLRLDHSRSSRSAEGVTGRILYDFSGNSCDGYALQFRQVSELNTGEGKSAVSDLRTITWEDGTATSYRFQSQNLVDQNQVETVDGQAERRSDGVAVNLTKPGRKKFDTDAGVVFPTEHMRRIIAAARSGQTILDLPVYDGSENGEKIFNTLTIIGAPIPPDQRVPTDAAAGQPALAGMTRWPVTISYFEKDAKAGEQTPIYSIAFELYDNGISRALTLDYNDFVLRGDMSVLEIKDSKPCR
ncbi:MAG TPA: cell envelope integrity EipB family protein [Xanthobacteraceae bacterium]|nr:cell envelope integrity EipB family protein [Xanthobacteraceae bacterium]